MAESEKAERKVKRTSFTKTLTAVQSYVSGGSRDKMTLLRHVHKLTDFRTELKELNRAIQLTLTGADLTADVERSAEYDEKAVDIIGELQAMIHQIDATASASQAAATQPASNANGSSSSGDATRHPELPKLTMVKFSGSPLEWDEFWDDFTGTVDQRTDLSNVTKFKYLKTCLKGEALRLAQGFRVTDANYSQVVQALKDRYADEDVAINAHFEALLELPKASQNVDQLRETYDKCEAHIRSLVALGQSEDTFGRVYVQIILKKLPIRVQEELHRKNGSGNKWTLTQLRKLLKDEIEAREKADTANAGTNYKRESGQEKSGGRTGHSGNYNTWSQSGKPQQGSKGTASALVFSATNRSGKPSNKGSPGKTVPSTPNCAFCDELHYSSSCQKVTDATTRSAKVKEKKLCLTCLSTQHQMKDCRSKDKECRFCNQTGHHQSLCGVRFGQKSTTTVALTSVLNPDAPQFTPASESNANTLSVNTTGVQAVMETATVMASGERRQEKTRILFDNGSTKSYVTKNKAKSLGAKCIRTETLSVAHFNENKRKSITRDVVSVDIFDTSGQKRTIELYVVNFISAPIELYPLDVADSSIVKTLTLAEPLVDHPTLVDIDILLGLDYYHDFIGDEKIRCPNGLVLMESCLGHVASGKVPGSSDNPSHETMFISAIPESVQQHAPMDLEKFWSIEEIGIKDNPKTTDDDLAMEHFNKTVNFSDGRYEVCWPYKTEDPDLPTNYGLALGRLNSLYKRLEADPELMPKYNQIIMDQVDRGIVEKAPAKPEGLVHYIPHHAVLKPERATTKIRIVYDGSAKSSKTTSSVNECMHRGPVILQDLVGLIMRFRLHRIAILSDVEKAFMMISLRMDQRDVTRFLWLKDITRPPSKDNIEIYRFRRVNFGFTSSPFLLGACIIHLLQQAGTHHAKSIEQNLYVDNILGGTESTEEAMEYYKYSVDLFATASMNLREWYTNDATFREQLADQHKGIGSTAKVLGLPWDVEKDSLVCTIGKAASAQVFTKRQLLQALAAVYDPCGYFSPITVTAKMIMQDIWRDGTDWDHRLAEGMLLRWKDCQLQISQIPNIPVPRQLRQSVYAPNTNIQLHCFCDASKKAYAAAIYIRIDTQTQCTVDLLLSKSRVAPLKQELKIPKLELVAALIGSRLLKFARKELSITVDSSTLWSDSECTLQWIKQKEPKEVFVRNRVRDIQANAEATFRYVRTEHNPADMPSRGVSADELAHSAAWWNGPDWLKLPPDKWPIHKLQPFNVESLQLKQPEVSATDSNSTACLVQATDDVSTLLDTGQFSSLKRLHRVTALVLKFIALARKQTRSPKLTARDMVQARRYWISNTQQQNFKELLSHNKLDKRWRQLKDQLSIFVDVDGLLRCRGRLGNVSTYDENNAILLPKNNHYTNLIIQDCHERVLHFRTKHTLARLRETYWVPHGREQVKKVVTSCKHCRRFHTGAYVPPKPPDLPHFRLAMARPFSRVGLDYIGHLYVKQPGPEKVWVCLFTCATTRAVYLDVVQSLTTGDFLLCLRRLSATYGTPKQIICDNAKQFHAGERLLAQIFRDARVTFYATSNEIEWKFITELAPWMGGFYERLVKPVKDALKKTLNRKLVNTTELKTVVMEIAAVINSRPLVYSESDVGDEPLTPAHFLMKAPSSWPRVPTEDQYLPTRESKLVTQWKRIQSVLDTFWNTWRTQYLRSLREHNTRPDAQGIHMDPQVGTVVQIADQQSRGNWRLGVISRLLPSADGRIRSVDVRLANGNTLRRATRQLHPLELSSNPTPAADNTVQQVPDIQVQRRPPRPQRAAATAANQALRFGADTESETDEE